MASILNFFIDNQPMFIDNQTMFVKSPTAVRFTMPLSGTSPKKTVVKPTTTEEKLIKCNIEACIDNELLHYPSNDVINIGDTLYLQTSACDGIEYTPTLYELYGIVDNYKQFPLNSYVVKQIGDKNNRIFALNRLQCKDLGITYKENLQLLPKSLDWKKYSPKNTFNPLDMSTYIHDEGRLRKFYIKVWLDNENDVDVNTDNFHIVSYNGWKLKYKFIYQKNEIIPELGQKAVSCYYLLVDNEVASCPIHDAKNKTISDLITVSLYIGKKSNNQLKKKIQENDVNKTYIKDFTKISNDVNKTYIKDLTKISWEELNAQWSHCLNTFVVSPF